MDYDIFFFLASSCDLSKEICIYEENLGKVLVCKSVSYIIE